MGKILSGDDARLNIKDGVDALANAVKVTLGPKGRNVIINNFEGVPHITKDGVTVAKSIELDDSVANIGAQLVKQVASKTADEAGDGTSSSVILAQAIYNNGIKYITKKHNSILVKKHLDNLIKLLSSKIVSRSSQLNNDYEKVKQVATISANNDVKIGTLIADAIQKANFDGIINIEETNNTETVIKQIEGLELSKGYLSPYFVTDDVKLTAEYENCLIFLFNDKINNFKDLFPVLKLSVSSNQPILIIANDYEEDVISNIIANKINGAIKVVAIKSPEFGKTKTDVLEDISILTNGKVFSDIKLLKDLKLEDLGVCNKIVVNNTKTLLIGGKGNTENIKQRVNFLKEVLKQTDTLGIAQREKIQERIAKLSNGVIIISLGATSEIELKENRDRIDDALCATRAAIEEGIIPGGSSVYLYLCTKFNDIVPECADIEYEIACNILKESLLAPFICLCINAGLNPRKMFKEYKTHNIEDNIGLNLNTFKFENLIESGIIEPVKVARVALENAANIASLFLTTEVVIDNKKAIIN